MESSGGGFAAQLYAENFSSDKEAKDIWEAVVEGEVKLEDVEEIINESVESSEYTREQADKILKLVMHYASEVSTSARTPKQIKAPESDTKQKMDAISSEEKVDKENQGPTKNTASIEWRPLAQRRKQRVEAELKAKPSPDEVRTTATKIINSDGLKSSSSTPVQQSTTTLSEQMLNQKQVIYSKTKKTPFSGGLESNSANFLSNDSNVGTSSLGSSPTKKPIPLTPSSTQSTATSTDTNTDRVKKPASTTTPAPTPMAAGTGAAVSSLEVKFEEAADSSKHNDEDNTVNSSPSSQSNFAGMKKKEEENMKSKRRKQKVDDTNSDSLDIQNITSDSSENNDNSNEKKVGNEREKGKDEDEEEAQMLEDELPPSRAPPPAPAAPIQSTIITEEKLASPLSSIVPSVPSSSKISNISKNSENVLPSTDHSTDIVEREVKQSNACLVDNKELVELEDANKIKNGVSVVGEFSKIAQQDGKEIEGAKVQEMQSAVITTENKDDLSSDFHDSYSDEENTAENLVARQEEEEAMSKTLQLLDRLLVLDSKKGNSSEKRSMAEKSEATAKKQFGDAAAQLAQAALENDAAARRGLSEMARSMMAIAQNAEETAAAYYKKAEDIERAFNREVVLLRSDCIRHQQAIDKVISAKSARLSRLKSKRAKLRRREKEVESLRQLKYATELSMQAMMRSSEPKILKTEEDMEDDDVDEDDNDDDQSDDGELIEFTDRLAKNRKECESIQADLDTKIALLEKDGVHGDLKSMNRKIKKVDGSLKKFKSLLAFKASHGLLGLETGDDDGLTQQK